MFRLLLRPAIPQRLSLHATSRNFWVVRQVLPCLQHESHRRPFSSNNQTNTKLVEPDPRDFISMRLHYLTGLTLINPPTFEDPLLRTEYEKLLNFSQHQEEHDLWLQVFWEHCKCKYSGMVDFDHYRRAMSFCVLGGDYEALSEIYVNMKLLRSDHEEALDHILVDCGVSSLREAIQICENLAKSGFSPNPAMFKNWVSNFVQKGKMSEVVEICDALPSTELIPPSMKDDFLRSLIPSYMASLTAKHGNPEDFAVLGNYLRKHRIFFGLRENLQLINNFLSSNSLTLNGIEAFHEFLGLKHSSKPSREIYLGMLKLYAKVGNLPSTQNCFKEMADKGLHGFQHFEVMISAALRESEVETAFRYLQEQIRYFNKMNPTQHFKYSTSLISSMFLTQAQTGSSEAIVDLFMKFKTLDTRKQPGLQNAMSEMFEELFDTENYRAVQNILHRLLKDNDFDPEKHILERLFSEFWNHQNYESVVTHFRRYMGYHKYPLECRAIFLKSILLTNKFKFFKHTIDKWNKEGIEYPALPELFEQVVSPSKMSHNLAMYNLAKEIKVSLSGDFMDVLIPQLVDHGKLDQALSLCVEALKKGISMSPIVYKRLVTSPNEIKREEVLRILSGYGVQVHGVDVTPVNNIAHIKKTRDLPQPVRNSQSIAIGTDLNKNANVLIGRTQKLLQKRGSISGHSFNVVYFKEFGQNLSLRKYGFSSLRQLMQRVQGVNWKSVGTGDQKDTLYSFNSSVPSSQEISTTTTAVENGVGDIKTVRERFVQLLRDSGQAHSSSRLLRKYVKQFGKLDLPSIGYTSFDSFLKDMDHISEVSKLNEFNPDQIKELASRKRELVVTLLGKHGPIIGDMVFENNFRNTFKEHLQLHRLGYRSVSEFLETIPDVRVVRTKRSPKYSLYLLKDQDSDRATSELLEKLRGQIKMLLFEKQRISASDFYKQFNSQFKFAGLDASAFGYNNLLEFMEDISDITIISPENWKNARFELRSDVFIKKLHDRTCGRVLRLLNAHENIRGDQQFMKLYREKYSEVFPVVRLGYKTIQQFLDSIPDHDILCHMDSEFPSYSLKHQPQMTNTQLASTDTEESEFPMSAKSPPAAVTYFGEAIKRVWSCLQNDKLDSKHHVVDLLLEWNQFPENERPAIPRDILCKILTHHAKDTQIVLDTLKACKQQNECLDIKSIRSILDSSDKSNIFAVFKSLNELRREDDVSQILLGKMFVMRCLNAISSTAPRTVTGFIVESANLAQLNFDICVDLNSLRLIYKAFLESNLPQTAEAFKQESELKFSYTVDGSPTIGKMKRFDESLAAQNKTLDGKRIVREIVPADATAGLVF